MSRRRVLVVTLVVLVVVVLLVPLWSGYFGPTAVTYVTTWRPWRSDLTVRLDQIPDPDSGHASLTVDYRDPWPGQTSHPGSQVRFVTVRRVHPLLPWVVTERGTGP